MRSLRYWRMRSPCLTVMIRVWPRGLQVRATGGVIDRLWQDFRDE